MKHGKQHSVAQSYLRAWCDPETPDGQDPYVWRFAKDGTDPRRKAPENIFRETDLYTIAMPDGGRDLRLEHGLSQLEGDFVKIRDSKLAKRQPLDTREHFLLCAFVAATHARTPAHRDHLADTWGQVLTKMDRMAEWAKTATPEQRRAAVGLPRSTGERQRSLTHEDVRALARQPLQTSLPVVIRTETPLLLRLEVVVLISGGEATFITSDNPCVWHDPEAYKLPPFFRAPALASPSIQITLPVSPRQMLLLRHGAEGLVYGTIPDPTVDDLNRRTRFHCTESFVTNSNTTRPIWFDPGEEPEDSWGKLHPEAESAEGQGS